MDLLILCKESKRAYREDDDELFSLDELLMDAMPICL